MATFSLVVPETGSEAMLRLKLFMLSRTRSIAQGELVFVDHYISDYLQVVAVAGEVNRVTNSHSVSIPLIACGKVEHNYDRMVFRGGTSPIC